MFSLIFDSILYAKVYISFQSEWIGMLLSYFQAGLDYNVAILFRKDN